MNAENLQLIILLIIIFILFPLVLFLNYNRLKKEWSEEDYLLEQEGE